MEEFAYAHIYPGLTNRMFDTEHPGHPGMTCDEYGIAQAAEEDAKREKEHIDQARWMQGGLASRGVTRDRDGYNTYEPAPSGKGTVILPLVLADLQDRAAHGHAKYGTYLRADNGRDALVDAYQEAMDLVMYLRQLLEERK